VLGQDVEEELGEIAAEHLFEASPGRNRLRVRLPLSGRLLDC
jgi:hypothetical protein